MALTAAHRGYEYQDLLSAARLVDVMLGSLVEVRVDEKLVPDDRFDDLTTVDKQGHRQRIQIKHTDNPDRPLTLATFTGDARSLRLDRVVAAALADRVGPGVTARELSFRIVLRDAAPSDPNLAAALSPANPDPGPFLPGFDTLRLRFNTDLLWPAPSERSTGLEEEANPFAFLQSGDQEIARADLEWVCDRLIVEVNAPAASLDLTAPDDAEHLLLDRARNEVGAEMYPNTDRTAIDVAEALIRAARAARQATLTVTLSELLRRTRLRSDFGAVARAHPVDKAIEVPRPQTVDELVAGASKAAGEGMPLLLRGPPGQGKSWACQQMIDALLDQGWLVAEHYCYLGDAAGDRLPRVLAESVFGSLMGRIAEYDPGLVSEQRPRFAADEQVLVDAVVAAIRKKPERRVALVIDGLDHVTRVRGGGADFDPSFTLAEALAALPLPIGSVLIILSQPGNHLEPLEATGAASVQIPRLNDEELRQIAARLGLVPSGGVGQTESSRPAPLLTEEEASDEFVVALSERSMGNALYATYLCREALRNPATMAAPAQTVRSLPEFDGSLLAYYQHIHSSLGEHGAWVADVIGLLDFPVTRSELKEIRPDVAHRVDQALSHLQPVLVERATQGGVRVYHESFARFLRQPFQNDERARVALLDRIIVWLEHKGLLSDSRAFHHLISTLSDAGYDRRVVDAVQRDFVILAIAAGFPASAIVANLARAAGSAARIGEWPAVVRYVELSRAAGTYQDERFESAIVGFVDVIVTLVGADIVAERLLDDGRPTMAARAGLQMCAAMDSLGAVVPWREYMVAFLKEADEDNTSYGEASDRAVDVAWLRGRLRLASLGHDANTEPGQSAGSTSGGGAVGHAGDANGRTLGAEINWELLAKRLDEGGLPGEDVIEAVLDTFGFSAVVGLVERLTHPGPFWLALAEEIVASDAESAEVDCRAWARRAVASGLPPGCIARLLALGLGADEVGDESIDTARDRLLELTREIQDRSVRWESGRLEAWMDLCAIAARRDPLGLSTAEGLLDGPGWYTCWLRFIVALAFTEAAQVENQPALSLSALRILTEVQNPFLGEPRACDLYSIHGWIEQSVRRAVFLLDDETWEKALGILDNVSAAISTTIDGEMGGPLARDRLLHLAVDTASHTRQGAARRLIKQEIETGGGGRYYSDLAEFRLIAARLEIAAGAPREARRHWIDACCFLAGYGWHKDITIFELLDPLPVLIARDPARGRVSVEKLQGLCERVPLHTDGRETRHACSRWWELLAAADPCALSRLVQPRLLSSCNDPNYLLHGARSDLWRGWYQGADPVVCGALRLTLDEPLDQCDLGALNRLADASDGTGSDTPARIMMAWVARFDERPYKYSYSNGEEHLERDREQVAQLNEIAARVAVSPVAPLPSLPAGVNDAVGLPKQQVQRSAISYGPHEPLFAFPAGAIGAAQAIRAWRGRSYGESRPEWSIERFANILGYRVIELLEDGRADDAVAVIKFTADAGGFDDRSSLLNAIAEGLERHEQFTHAAGAYALAWTRARGRGGWMAFGGQTEIESLRAATRLDVAVALATIADEVEQVISRGAGTHGIAQALIYGFVQGGLGDSDSAGFELWDEAFAVIADRAPWVSEDDDPEDSYVAPVPDVGAPLIGDLNVAFAEAVVAGLAHSGREQKRRALAATSVLIDERPDTVSNAINTALSSLSDPATLTWLLRLLEISGANAGPIISRCREGLSALANRPHLTVRAIARRLLSGVDIPMPPPSEPDEDLLEKNSAGILLLDGVETEQKDVGTLMDLVEETAGERLARAELILPRLKNAVCTRMESVLKSEVHQRRMKRQWRAYGDTLEERWPEAYLATHEAVEDAVQRVGASARAARLMNGQPVTDPVQLEDALAEALLDDPELPVALELTRHPRPEIPTPTIRGDPLWRAIRARAVGTSIDETDVVAAMESGAILRGTISISSVQHVPTLQGGAYNGWRLLATVERRVMPRLDWKDKDKDDHIAERYRVVELRVGGDRQALTLPPIARADIQSWGSVPFVPWSIKEAVRSQPIIGADSAVRAGGDGHQGLGIQKPLFAPTPWLFGALGLRPRGYFVLEDDGGDALAMITWRAEYETSDYHLPWPRLSGSGLAIRSDAFDRLISAAHGGLIFRDFLAGPIELCG